MSINIYKLLADENLFRRAIPSIPDEKTHGHVHSANPPSLTDRKPVLEIDYVRLYLESAHYHWQINAPK